MHSKDSFYNSVKLHHNLLVSKAQRAPLYLHGFERLTVSQSCPTVQDPMDYTVNGILQARILEWVAIPFSRESSQPRNGTQVSFTAGRSFTI